MWPCPKTEYSSEMVLMETCPLTNLPSSSRFQLFSVFIREDSRYKPKTPNCLRVCLEIAPSKVYSCRSASWLPLQRSWRWSRCVQSLPQSERTRCWPRRRWNPCCGCCPLTYLAFLDLLCSSAFGSSNPKHIYHLLVPSSIIQYQVDKIIEKFFHH